MVPFYNRHLATCSNEVKVKLRLQEMSSNDYEYHVMTKQSNLCSCLHNINSTRIHSNDNTNHTNPAKLFLRVCSFTAQHCCLTKKRAIVFFSNGDHVFFYDVPHHGISHAAL